MLRKTIKASRSVDFKIDKSAQSGMIKISGKLTERKANEVKKKLENSAGTVDYFKLNLEEVTDVDLSSIHLLYSTCESMDNSNRPLSLDGICPVVFTSAVEDVGFSYHDWLCFGQ